MKRSAVPDLDRDDPLAAKRQEFVLPEGVIYLDGNSLGALPAAARARTTAVVAEQWGGDLIQSWNRHRWIDMPREVGEKIAALIGAAPGQTLCCDSTSVNLFKLLSCALAMQADRRVVLTELDNFPADLYIADGYSRFAGADRCQVRAVAAAELAQHLTQEVAVLLLTHVNFRTAAMHDLEGLTRLAHEQGILVVWDLAHSAGAVPLELDAWQVDFAVGCGYKYFNGGPGAPAFIYAAARHHAQLGQPLTGWMGHRDPFAFAPDYVPAPGVEQFLCGTPAILSMSALDAALDVFGDVDMRQLRRKSLALSDLFLQLKEAEAALADLRLVSPREGERRGSHLAFAHPAAFAICQALIAQGVIVDYRAPDILRLGFAPLYLRYRDILDSVVILREVVASKRYLDPAYAARAKVT